MPRKPRPRRVSIVRYQLPDGTRCRKNTPGAVKVTKKSRTFYAKIGGDLVPLKTEIESEAWSRLRQLLAGGGRYLDEQQRPIEDHLPHFQQHLLDKGTGKDHVAVVLAHVRSIVALAGWHRLADLSTESCTFALARLQEPAQGSLSAQTRNHYARHAKQFSRWCRLTRRLAEDPLDAVGLISVEADRRHDRRCPTDEEIGLLFAHLESDQAVTRCDMSPRCRALGYRVAMATGFRASELRSLSRESFDLDAGEVTVRAGYSKRRRRDTQQIPGWLVAELREWFAAGGSCWEQFPRNKPGRLLQADLALARRLWIEAATTDQEREAREKSDVLKWEVVGPDGPLFFDFHALRVHYITWAASLPGISPKALMEMARHSDPKLTLGVYAKVRKHDLRSAIDQMPPPGKPEQSDASKHHNERASG